MSRNFKNVAIARGAAAGLAVMLAVSAHGQVSQSLVSTPPSFSQTLSTDVPVTTMPAVDHAALLAEDEAEAETARQTGAKPPYRTALPQEVSLNFTHGRWETLPNGDRVWRLRIVSPQATDLCLQYDQWRIVKPCELWLYNDDRSAVLGPFTYIDNWDGTNITEFTSGDAVTLEYHVPAGVEDVGDLSIVRVLHGYKNFMGRRTHRNDDALDVFGASMACEINVRCFPDWDYEKRAVAMVLLPNLGRWCSGAMLNNTAEDGAANFLTADHCFLPSVTNWLFYFNYESPACNPTTDGDTTFVIRNANVLARADTFNADFMLLRLSRPRPEGPFIPTFMGWNRANTPAPQTWGIHHPSGDVKKISTDNNPAVNTDWNGIGANNYWQVEWDQGITEGGSSGSPLFNGTSHVIGQLTGGSSDCITSTEETDTYGKLAVGWEGTGVVGGRLRDWLDPNNTGAMVINSIAPTAPVNDSCGPGQNVPLITFVPYSHSGSTQWAANNHDGTNGDCSGTNTAPDVVYQLLLNCEHQVTVSTCGSNYDTQLFIETGECLIPGHYNRFCSDDEGCGATSEITFTAQPGVVYKIWVDGYASAFGNYVLNITGVASGSQGNSACPGYQITQVPFFAWGANWCGGDHVNPECRPTSDGDDIHWYWISPYNQTMRAKTCFTNFDTILEVRYDTDLVGPACGEYLAGCNDDALCGGDPLASAVVFDAYNGGRYFLHVDGYNGATGMTSLELEVYNDDCESPITVNALPSNFEGDTRPAQDDFATVVGAGSKEVFFKYTSPVCQTIFVHTCDDELTGFDTGLEVRTGGPCPGSTLVAFNDDAPGVCGAEPRFHSQLEFRAEANRTYYIIVSGFIGGPQPSEGPFMVYFSSSINPQPLLADVCPGIYIPSLPFTDFGNTSCMTNNYSNCVGASAPEMVYYMNRPQCEMVTVSLCGSTYDAAVGVYGGTCPNIAPLVACNDDNNCGGVPSLQSTVTFLAEANTNYQILVHGHPNNPVGPYQISVTGTPCPPQRVDDAVAQFDLTTGNVTLAWNPAPGADRYKIYRSSNYETLWDPANVIAIVVGTSYTCEGCINDPANRSFFGVIAEDVDAGPAIMSEPPVVDRPDLRKPEAAQDPAEPTLEFDHFAAGGTASPMIYEPPNYVPAVSASAK